MNKQLTFIIPALALLVPLFFIQNAWIPAAFILILILLILFKHMFVLPFIVISFLTLTSTISPQLRLVVQLFNTALLLFFFYRDIRHLDPIRFPPIPKEVLYLVAAVFISMSLSTLFSSYKQDGIQQIIRSAMFLLIIYLVYTQIKSDKEVRIIIKSLTAAALFYALFLLYELYNNNFAFISVQQQITHVYGLDYRNKNFLGGFLSIIAILLLSFYFKPGTSKIKYSLMIFILLLGVILTNSRAALLALFISFLVVLFQHNRKYFTTAILGAIAVTALLFISPLSDLLMIYIRLESVSTGRDHLIESSVEVIKNNFLLGAGPAATRHEMYNSLQYMLGSPEELFLRRNFYMGELGQAHSFYLFLFSDLGIIGFIISIMFPLIYFKYLRKLLINNPDKSSYYHYLFKGLIAVGIFIFIRGLFEPAGIFTFGNLGQDLPFWMLFAIISYFYIRVPADEKN